MMSKRIFIGSSSKALDKAHIVKSILTELGAETILWSDPEAFPVSHNTIDTLIDTARQCDGAVLIFDKDDQVIRNDGESREYLTRDNVIAEAGMFAGVLGKESVVLCTVPGIHEISDFKGITTLPYDSTQIEKMKVKLKLWLTDVQERTGIVRKNNVLFRSRHEMDALYTIDELLHISDSIYKQIIQIRLMNLCCNHLINPQVCDPFHNAPGDIQLRDAIEKILNETNATMDLILLDPNEYNLKDVKTKIANRRAGSAAGALYSALSALYKDLTEETIYAARYKSLPILFQIFMMKTSMPFGIFGAEFAGEASKYNYVKVDLYSAALDSEGNRRSFVIWQADDPENYSFFVNNFEKVKNNEQLCEKLSLKKLKAWGEKWERRKQDEVD